jgi:hypothetical protein
MKKFLLLLVVTPLAWAGPTGSLSVALFKPYYPSPYVDQGWVYGSQCMWSWGKDGYFRGVCHYTASPNGNNGAQGWAEVHWRMDDYTPVSAVPCKVPKVQGGDDSPDSKPECPMPPKFKLGGRWQPD